MLFDGVDLQFDIASTQWQWALNALVVYDYLITLDGEIEIVWRRKLTVTSALLISCRWLNLAGVLAAFANEWFLHQAQVPSEAGVYYGCKVSLAVSYAILLASYLLVAIVTALRASVLWSMNKPLFEAVFVLGVVPVATNLFTFSVASFGVDEFPDLPYPDRLACYLVSDVPVELSTALLYLTRVSALLADVITIVFTWMKTFRQVRQGRRLNMALTLTTYIFRDGTIYFLALFLISLLRMVPNLALVAISTGANSTLPLILIGRFLMNLRQLAEHVDESGTERSHFSQIEFRAATRIGNITEELDFGPYSAVYGEVGESEGGIELVDGLGSREVAVGSAELEPDANA